MGTPTCAHREGRDTEARDGERTVQGQLGQGWKQSPGLPPQLHVSVHHTTLLPACMQRLNVRVLIAATAAKRPARPP